MVNLEFEPNLLYLCVSLRWIHVLHRKKFEIKYLNSQNDKRVNEKLTVKNAPLEKIQKGIRKLVPMRKRWKLQWILWGVAHLLISNQLSIEALSQALGVQILNQKTTTKPKDLYVSTHPTDTNIAPIYRLYTSLVFSHFFFLFSSFGF